MRPPIGIKPKKLHDEERFNQLHEAIYERASSTLEIPIEWVQEYNEYIEHIRNEYNQEFDAKDLEEMSLEQIEEMILRCEYTIAYHPYKRIRQQALNDNARLIKRKFDIIGRD